MNLFEFPAQIGIFDSGAGAVSFVPAMMQRAPNSCIHLRCDTANFPYGPLSDQDLKDAVRHAVGSWPTLAILDVVVIACNTASTIVLDSLREEFKHLPFVGVVPAIKPAAALSQNQAIALLATEGTNRRAYVDKLIAEYASEVEVLRISSSRLVEICEEKLRGNPPEPKELREIVEPILNHGKIDVLVLGCTHFPWVANELQAILGSGVQIVDSIAAVCDQTIRTLQKTYTIKRQSTDLVAKDSRLLLSFTELNPQSEQIQLFCKFF